MLIEFKKVSSFDRGTLYTLLEDAYSYDERIKEKWGKDWEEMDAFFFDHLAIADKYGFITTVDNQAIGFASWDPRKAPAYLELGHNCIIESFKNKSYGKLQLQEAVKRMRQTKCIKLIVTTNQQLIPAQKMYEGLGFKEKNRRKNDGPAAFMGEYIDYEMLVGLT